MRKKVELNAFTSRGFDNIDQITRKVVGYMRSHMFRNDLDLLSWRRPFCKRVNMLTLTWNTNEGVLK